MKTTYLKVEKKFCKQIYSDFDSIIKFEKTVNSVLNDKRLNPELKKKLAVSTKLMQGAENNTNKMRRQLLELIRNKERVIKE